MEIKHLICIVNFIIVSADFKHISYIYVNYDLNNIIKLDLLCLFVFNHYDNITLTLYIIETPKGVLLVGQICEKILHFMIKA